MLPLAIIKRHIPCKKSSQRLEIKIMNYIK